MYFLEIRAIIDAYEFYNSLSQILMCILITSGTCYKSKFLSSSYWWDLRFYISATRWCWCYFVNHPLNIKVLDDNHGFFFAFIAVEGTFTYIISRDLTISLLDLHRIYCWWELYLISYVFFFSGSHVRMWELDHRKGWALENWCFWTVVLEKTFESPLDCKEIKPVNPKGNQSWIFIGRTDVEAETPILWPPDMKSQLMVKDPDARKDWGQEEKGATEDEMVGLTQWTWVWANSWRQWRTEEPRVLQFMGLQRAGHDWATEQQRQQRMKDSELLISCKSLHIFCPRAPLSISSCLC